MLEENDNHTYVIETGPTETSLYVLDILQRYGKLKIFKKRYFVKRNNKFGIGIRKRVIPTRKLLGINNYILSIQQKITDRIPDILEVILKNQNTQDPTVYNFLKLIRKWLLEFPMAGESFNDTKWLERRNFERFYKTYLINFISFSKIDFEISEKIMVVVEDALRQLPVYAKSEISKDDSDFEKSSKEKNNFLIEKNIYEFLMILRSFLSSNKNDDTFVSELIRKKYKINSLYEYLNFSIEALVFQKKFTINELVNYFEVRPAVVNAHEWDMSDEQLKKYGRDPETIKQKKIEHLKRKFLPYQLIGKFLDIEISGKGLLEVASVEQWRQIDLNKKNDFDYIYKNNYLGFLESILNYYKNTFYHLVDDSEITFKNRDDLDVTGKIFDRNIFSKIISFEKILDELHYFKSNNPTLSISRREVVSIAAGKIETMTSVSLILENIGKYFYYVGTELLKYYESHILWIKQQKKNQTVDVGDIEKTLLVLDDLFLEPAAFPYYCYTFVDYTDESSNLSKLISGRKIIGDNLYSGIVFHMIAFSFQIAKDCFNENLNIDIRNGKDLLLEINKLKRTNVSE